MGKKTPKHHKHVEAGARIVDFGGWDMMARKKRSIMPCAARPACLMSPT
jgi:glycine cleavage system aminomethyltransferase T